MHPQGLTNEIIQNIGKNYLNHFGEKPGWHRLFYRQNHSVANMLKAYDDKDSSIQDKWNFLIDAYALLNGEMLIVSVIGSPIVRLFQQAFNKKITENDKKQTICQMKEISNLYFLNNEVKELKATVSLLAKNQK
jgi:hypothetical protein